ncbi:MAG: xanthine dehydrogenase small subunit [Hyphomicrobiaceae bacterium]|nr:xanthine dehydrogenase small subunit [Hyphomicrobiaceae bacterium]MCC0023345.1 xanthine dehydrogenase small subunit [Hyphomicrobiaceae bacterium]
MSEARRRNEIRFYLNDELVEARNFSPDLTLLDYLRIEKRLTGTKEGCAEGDCGACTVLVGRLSGDNLIYETVNSCIRFLGTLDGCHVVSVEHLSGSDGKLNPVQQAMVEMHGSQCGFCTPGIVMSLYALWMQNPAPSVGDVEEALQGNLCRCTGYAPIVKAAMLAAERGGQAADVLVAHRVDMREKLRALRDGLRVEVVSEKGQLFIPADLDDFAELYEEVQGATLVAGSTDVGLWVTKFMRDIEPVIFIGAIEDLHKWVESEGAVTLGAGVTYSEFLPFVDERIPQLSAFWRRIGGQQVRNMGTIGGNIANGSPIGDTPPALIALGAAITLRKGGERRFLPLESYFLEYGKQDRKLGEFVEMITVPLPDPDSRYAVYKISKRRDEDISSVCGAFNIKIEDGLVTFARIAFGGMAATPKRADAVEAALTGRPWSEDTIVAGKAAFAEDFRPISDMRASADYRLMAAQNLLERFYRESLGEEVSLTREAAE